MRYVDKNHNVKYTVIYNCVATKLLLKNDSYPQLRAFYMHKNFTSLLYFTMYENAGPTLADRRLDTSLSATKQTSGHAKSVCVRTRRERLQQTGVFVRIK